MKTIEQAVNKALNNLDIVQSKDFADLMASLYAKLEEAENSSHYNYTQIVEEVKNAIGEFVSS